MAGETLLLPTEIILLDADEDEWNIRSINPALTFLNDQFVDVGGTPIVKIGAGGTGSASGSITGPGPLTFTAGGTNNNITLVPSGTGSIVLSGPVVPSAPIRLPAGTVALPALTTVGSLGTGLAFPATNTLTVSTAGAERLRITSGGLVGIGMTPVNRLDVNGDATVDRLGIGGSLALTEPLQVYLNSDDHVWVRSNANAENALTSTMRGLRLSATGVSLAARYFPPILWASQDPAFTTENPKLVAFITAAGTEAYDADTDGGASLIFAVAPDNPGGNSVPVIRMILDQDGGLTLGGLASQGAGTLNATAVYDNGVLLADFVFTPDYPLRSIAETTAFYRAHQHLPTIPGRDSWEQNGAPPVGQTVSYLTETVEVQARHITELHERLAVLEGAARR